MSPAARRSLSQTQELLPIEVARLADLMAMSDLELAIYGAQPVADAIADSDHAELFSTEAR